MLTTALLVGFLGLVAEPRALIVDGERPWVDEGHRPGARPIGNDLTGLFLPRFLWQAEHWRQSGRIPQWDPRGFAGRPNAGNPQSGLWYPPAWVAWAWSEPEATGWLTVAHLLWAGAGAFALGRAVGLGRVAATVSGTALMLNPYVIAQVHEGHLPHVWSASWYPWAFLGALRLRAGSRAGWALLPLSLALSLMAGHPQEGVYLAAALGAWAAIDVTTAVAHRIAWRTDLRCGASAPGRPSQDRGSCCAGIWGGRGFAREAPAREPSAQGLADETLSGWTRLFQAFRRVRRVRDDAPPPTGASSRTRRTLRKNHETTASGCLATRDRPSNRMSVDPESVSGPPGAAAPHQARETLPPGPVAGRRLGFESWRRVRCWAVAFALAAGLAAVEWVPVLLARPYVAGPLGGAGGGGTGPYHLHASNLLQLFSPRALGGPADYLGRGNLWETLLSVGWAPLVLVVAAIAAHPDRRAVRGWSALLVLSVVHAAGDALGLSAILAAVPGMGGVRVPARSLFLAATAAAVLAGMGVEAMERAVDRWRAVRQAKRFGAVVGLIGLLVAAVAVADRVGGSSHERPPGESSGRWVRGCGRIAGDGLFLGSLAATATAVAWRSLRPADGGRAASAIGAVAVAELAASAALALSACPAAVFLGPDAVGLAVERTRPEGPSRVRSRDAFYTDLHAWRDGVEKANLGDLFQLRHAAEVYRALYPLFDGPDAGPLRRFDPDQARSALDRMGVDRVITDRPLRLAIGPELASGSRGNSPFSVVANPTALPRAYVVPGAVVVEDARTLDRLPEVDPRSAVVMAADPPIGLDGPRQPFTPASYAASDPDRVVVRATTSAPGLLVVLDAWMPGWSATVDGRPSPVLRGDHAFRVVSLPGPGRHEVVLSYQSPGLSAGAAITAGSAALLFALLWPGIRVSCRLPRLLARPSSPHFSNFL